jgi:hypothetical protein
MTKSKLVFWAALLLLLAHVSVSASFQQRRSVVYRTALQQNHEENHDENKAPGRRTRKAAEKRQEYERRRAQWMERYGTLTALQNTFGAGPGWGDLTPEQTRRLYHTLLPRSLLGLFEMGLMNPEELAPLAYQARIAAKEYARSRCVWTARLLTTAFDQYRNLRDRGRLGASSMTWDELWQKYEAQIVQEECMSQLNKKKKTPDQETLTMRIYLRILERSCVTNQAFDRLFLSQDDHQDDQLYPIAQQLEQDVCTLLLRPKEAEKVEKKSLKMEKKQQKAERKEEKQQQKADRKEEKQQQKAERKEEKRNRRLEEKEAVTAVNTTTAVQDNNNTFIPAERWEVLRILAGTRRKFRHFMSENSKRDR